MKKLLLLITFLSSFFVRGQMTKDDLIGKTFVADVTQYTPEINGEPLYKHSYEKHPQVNLYLIFEKTQVIVKEENRVTKQVFRKDTRSWTLKGNLLKIPQTKKNIYYAVDQFQFYFEKGKLIGTRVTWDKNIEKIVFKQSNQ
ncbi:MAG: hypothetical protein Q3983_09540 [Capnocytophaga sp.]|nr:hypothetical protein [Capnocytophaga sp.]